MLLTVLSVLGVVENVCVIAMFYRYRREYKSRTIHLLMSLAVSDGLMALIGGSMYATSSFMHRWPFTYQGSTNELPLPWGISLVAQLQKMS